MIPHRAPTSQPPARIAPLATLPVFHKLQGRFVVLAGHSDGVRWKAELLAAAGAEVRLFAPPGAFAEPFADARIRLQDRPWKPADFAGAALAIGDFETDDQAGAFAAAARKAGIPVNLIDRPAFCDFQFGAIVNRSPLVISISTDGAAPVFGQAIRARIEAMLPPGLAHWAAAARDWRRYVQASRPAYALRRLFWERFTERAMAEPERRPDAGDRRDLLRAFARDRQAPPAGRVSLVGAGPGDPDLLTLKALRALHSADVILHDDLVAPEILDLARRESERIRVGKTGHGPSCRQGDISALIVREALAGKRVVRLKGGDPLIFGRATEEIDACRRAGVAVDIIPGISSAQGAAAVLGFSLTERKKARRIQYVTGHGEDGLLPADMNWAAIADPVTTTVVYMPRRTLEGFVREALAAGLAPATPAVAVVNATRPTQIHRCARIDALPVALGDLPETGPMLVMIGAVIREIQLTDIEMNLPLIAAE
ncbi:siroheme synthase CysG [Rhabdaerophilum sp. SD176]|uniref:siroheme synthase CysG n=1 Tax=Rhabdaerophilum sp. SD176 TaxID=2983548 RepID=UPI0024DFA161|nr:siroheme synthase CysG [Rhabdaerophilum sp. SD176]